MEFPDWTLSDPAYAFSFSMPWQEPSNGPSFDALTMYGSLPIGHPSEDPYLFSQGGYMGSNPSFHGTNPALTMDGSLRVGHPSGNPYLFSQGGYMGSNPSFHGTNPALTMDGSLRVGHPSGNPYLFSQGGYMGPLSMGNLLNGQQLTQGAESIPGTMYHPPASAYGESSAVSALTRANTTRSEGESIKGGRRTAQGLQYKKIDCNVKDSILFKNWRVSCSAGTQTKAVGRGEAKTVKTVIHANFNVHPHIDYLPIDSLREKRYDRVRFAIDLAIVPGFRPGGASWQKGVVDALSKKHPNNYLHPDIRKDMNRVYKWVAKKVDWEKALQPSKFCLLDDRLNNADTDRTGARNGQRLRSAQGNSDQPDLDADAVGETDGESDAEADIVSDFKVRRLSAENQISQPGSTFQSTTSRKSRVSRTIREPAASAIGEGFAGNAVAVPSTSPSELGSAASSKRKPKEAFWDISDSRIHDAKGRVIEWSIDDEEFFGDWTVTCNATPSLLIDPTTPENTGRRVNLKFVVKPPLMYLPEGCSKKNRKDRIRFTILLDRDKLSALQAGNVGSQEEVANALLAGQKFAKRRLDSKIPYQEVFRWMVKTVNWKKVGEKSKC
jgi:hypothetical protein